MNKQNLRRAEILCVGTELLIGDIVNTNAAYLSRRLAALGIGVYRQSVVGDNPERLAADLRTALERADLVITSGGLGPTYDDLTKETAAAVFYYPSGKATNYTEACAHLYTTCVERLNWMDSKVQSHAAKAGYLIPLT